MLPSQAGREFRADVLTTNIPVEHLSESAGFSRDEIVQRFLYETDSGIVKNWPDLVKETLNIPKNTENNGFTVRPVSYSFSPAGNELVMVANTNKDSTAPLEDIDLYAATLRRNENFSEITVKEVKKIPSEETPAPLEFTLLISVAEPQVVAFAPVEITEIESLTNLRAVPDDFQQTSLLQDFQDLGIEHNISFSNLDFFNNNASVGNVRILSATSAVTGTLRDTLRFLNDLANHPRKINVKKVDTAVKAYRGNVYLAETKVMMEMYAYEE